MTNTLPSKNSNLLKSLLGKRIVSVKRQIFKDDMDLNDWQQNADGPIEFQFDNDMVIHFIVKTELDSIGVIVGKMPRYGDSYLPIDVSNNSFWFARVGHEIIRLTLLKSPEWSGDYPSEFGVEVLFSNGKKALVEYLNELDHPDMVRVSEGYSGLPCITQTFQVN